MPNLVQLEVIFTRTYHGLGAMLRQLPQLRAFFLLHIRSLSDELLHDLADALPHLPLLTAFAVQRALSYVPLSLTQAAGLCGCLRGRSRLRCFYFNFQFSSEDLPTYFAVIATLTNLEIYGLSYEGHDLDAAFFADLQHYLPPRLSVLTLRVDVDSFSDPSAFHMLWAHFHRLTFLHVEIDDDGYLTAEDVVCGTENLPVVGLNDQFYRVDYQTGEPIASLTGWSCRKVLLREAEDFGCEEWNWMMRHIVLPGP